MSDNKKNPIILNEITSQQARTTYWDRKYEEDTPIWDRNYPSPLLVNAIEQNLIKQGTVISIGCGTGTNEIYLATKGFTVTAIDLSKNAINIAIDKASKANVTINWICGDILNLQNNLSTYDIIFDRGCYHHIRYSFLQKYIEMQII